MENVRGQERNPGEFRHSQNWIGGQGSTLKTARYIPPAPEDMDPAISVFHYLEANPIIDIGKTAEATGLSFNTVATAVKKLTDMNILSQTNAAARNRTFAYTDYLDLLRDGT
ncbi:MAG: winged helix-turn-helix domain-containing protein [Acidaminococcaceae bacterium]|nr:winged helix-turn-helix domain-containing protein [Acidaminococcaceae bacterium]